MRKNKTRRIGTYIFWIYRALSIVVVILCTLVLLFQSGNYYSYFSISPIIIVTLSLLCVTTLISMIWKGGFRSLINLFHSARFRLTLWYTALLALMMLLFGTIIYATETQNLKAGLLDALHVHLAQAGSSYNPQTGRLSFTPGNDVQVATNNGVVHLESIGSSVVLLMSLQGKVLQTLDASGTAMDAGSVSTLIDQVTGDYLSWQKSSSNNNRPLLAFAGSGLSVYSFDSVYGPYELSSGPEQFIGGVVVNQQQHPLALLAVGIFSDFSFQLQNLLNILEITFPLVLLLSCVGGYWLAGRAMRPVEVITHTAQKISETGLHLRLNLKRRDELGELAATFDHMLTRLEAAFERQRQFTADASHELRTPLTIIDLEATRALGHTLTLEEYQRAITIMQQENGHMTRLVNDLLVLARADNAQPRLQHEKVDLAEVVVDTVERLAPLAQHTAVTIQVPSLPELPVLGDHAYLVQLLTNIVENALKYSAGVGTRVDIELVPERKNDQAWATLRVRDNGPGIAEEHLPHLFERFYRVDQSRTHSQELALSTETGNGRSTGSGLGLSIAQWIAQAHGGDIHVQSIPGLGTVFEIWLPLIPAHFS